MEPNVGIAPAVSDAAASSERRDPVSPHKTPAQQDLKDWTLLRLTWKGARRPAAESSADRRRNADRMPCWVERDVDRRNQSAALRDPFSWSEADEQFSVKMNIMVGIRQKVLQVVCRWW